MLTKYKGVCDFCGRETHAGKGDFQSIGSLPQKYKHLYTGKNYQGKWLIRCFHCKGAGNTTLKIENYLANQNKSCLK